MNKKVTLPLILSVTFLILFSYQNCGVDAPQSMFDFIQGYKVPYEAKVDQLAYMSCSEQQGVPNDSGVFYTFRVGAYGDKAGLRLNEEFLYQTRRKDPDDRALILNDEFGTRMHRLQFALRQQSDLGAMYVNSGNGEGIEEMDFDFVFGNLGTPEMSASLVFLKENEYMNYWAAGGTTMDAYMEGTMVFNSSENLSANLRSFMSDRGILTLGYALDTDPGLLLTRAAYNTPGADDDGDGRDNDADDDMVPKNQAFGVGLRMSFRQPNPANWGYAGAPPVSLPKRALATVQEYDLSIPNKVKASWTCPTELQLRIIRPEHKDLDDPGFDSNPATESPSVIDLCPDAADPVSPQTEVDKFKMVRRSLPVSDWKINWERKCVVPLRHKKGSCYGIDTSKNPTVTRNPVYDFRYDCDPAVSSAQMGVCLHFVSICYKP